ncbi:angiopoietin-1 [Erpetoichthys calabaricus]|uniref:Angiopoietin 4 n=1 Tax=Erpetoichthys calabaricus TaxID=27687 RepID=A0A8C4X983_ERPCA|nr:angiopoietin-1 [Erpetoichthys calabaricus]
MMLTSFCLSVLITGAAAAASGGGQRRGGDGSRRRLHRVQHGQCSYTFVLPEVENCRGNPDQYGTAHGVQRDSPSIENEWSMQRLHHLENAMQNNTQWLQKLENVIQESIQAEMVQIQAKAVQNQTATMLEIGTNLLTQTAEQTRKLTDVEAQVLNQTSRIEIQLLENSLSTNKLEKQLLLQINELSKLHDRNSVLENKVLEIEAKHRTEVESIKLEKARLQQIVSRQTNTIESLEKQLHSASNNNSALQKQQLQLMDSVRTLVDLVTEGRGVMKKEDKIFRDCSEIYKSGIVISGVYFIRIKNITEPVKVFCDMETGGGGWTVFQRRENGSVEFQKTWREYKMGFGDAAGEHWLGNEAVHLLTNQASYSLRIELKDWEGNQKYSLYEQFQLGSERQLYRMVLKGYSGTAGQQSSLLLNGANFSTRDSDNDNCNCKCALMLTGGWWFDACGLSNLNGIYYTFGHNIRKLNGIKWHHFRGPSYSLRSTAMMIRPSDF